MSGKPSATESSERIRLACLFDTIRVQLREDGWFNDRELDTITAALRSGTVSETRLTGDPVVDVIGILQNAAPQVEKGDALQSATVDRRSEDSPPAVAAPGRICDCGYPINQCGSMRGPYCARIQGTDTLSAPSAEALKRDIRSIRNDAEADAVGVDRFRTAMSNKLAEKRADGRGGWNHEPYTVQPDRGDRVWRGGCSIAQLRKMLREHFENGNGDMVDIANFAMMIWNRENPDG